MSNLTFFDTTHYKVHFGGQVPDWDGDARFGVKERGGSTASRSSRWPRAFPPWPTRGSTSRAIPPRLCGVLIGSGIGGLNEFETQHKRRCWTKGPSRISPFTIPKLMVNAGQRPGLDPLRPSGV